jgi:hypothetical protein
MFKHPFNNSTSNKDSLQRIQFNLKKQRALTKRVQSFLPSELAEHCIHVTLSCKKKANNITLYTHSSVWASKLLYLRKQILAQASKEFNEPLQSFKVKVISKGKTTLPKPKPLKPSLSTLENMALASTSIENSALKESLLHLINTLKK